VSEVSSKAITETTAVRAGEALDWLRLASYIRARLAESGEPVSHDEMSVEQFPGGHSNLTYLLRFGTREYVCRRPPFGTLPPRAHDMAREYRLLARVHPVFTLAPRTILLCEDAGVIGATFYLMERRRGAIIRAHEPAQTWRTRRGAACD
jgi:aminoglycoside phosphotransferase (APT) family kinase protein